MEARELETFSFLSYKFYLEADLVDECLDYAENYLNNLFKDNISKFTAFTEDDITFNLRTNYSPFYVHLNSNELEISITCTMKTADTDVEYDDFSSKVTPILNKYIKHLETIVNELLECDDIFGYLPKAEITVIDDSIYVKLGYHQSSIELETSAASIELSPDEFIGGIIGDLYYDFKKLRELVKAKESES